MPVRIYEMSKKLGLENRDILALAEELGISEAKVASSCLDKVTAARLEEECLKKYGSYRERWENQSKAAQSYRECAEQGDPEAQFNLSVCYDRGKGVSRNDSEAMKWLCKAAEQGHAAAFERLVNKMDREERWRNS